MPVEIYELVVKATVKKHKKENQKTDSKKSDSDCSCKDEVKQAAVEQALEIVKRLKER